MFRLLNKKKLFFIFVIVCMCIEIVKDDFCKIKVLNDRRMALKTMKKKLLNYNVCNINPPTEY